MTQVKNQPHITIYEQYNTIATFLKSTTDYGYPMYANSQGMDQDNIQAIKWYTKASKQCFNQAQINLWDMYASGKAGKENVPKVNWFYNPSENPVCVKVGNAKSKPDEYKISPSQFPNGIFVSVIRKPMFRDPVRFPNVEKILAAELKEYGFKIADSSESASAVISFNTNLELDLTEIEKGETDRVSRGLSVLDNVAGVFLRGKLSGNQAVMANGISLKLSNKRIALTADLDNRSQDKKLENSLENMDAYYSEDGYETSTKLLILALDEWAKAHIVAEEKTLIK
jgi:hypothetical protein